MMYGWKPSPTDERDWHPETLKAMVKLQVARPVKWSLPKGLYLSQGNTPHCVGFAGAGFVAAEGSQSPIDSTVDNDLGHALYYEAKVWDQQDYGDPIGNLETGSCLRSLAKALRARGTIDAYSLTSSFSDADWWVETQGSVAIGVYWWTPGMRYPDANGLIRPVGEREGGHAVLWRSKDQIWGNGLPNTWGRDWGLDGECFISDQDLRGLLLDQGEALLMVKLAVNQPQASKRELCHFGKAMRKLWKR